MALIGAVAVGLDAAPEIHPSVELDDVYVPEDPTWREHHRSSGGIGVGERFEVRAPGPQARALQQVAVRHALGQLLLPLARSRDDGRPARLLPLDPYRLPDLFEETDVARANLRVGAQRVEPLADRGPLLRRLGQQRRGRRT